MASLRAGGAPPRGGPNGRLVGGRDTADRHVVEHQVVDVLRRVGHGRGGDREVGERDGADRVAGVRAQDGPDALAVGHGPVGQVDVGDVWREVAGLVVVLRVDEQHRPADRSGSDPVHIRVVYEAAAQLFGLDPVPGLQVRAVHGQVPGVDVLHAAGHLAADRDAAVPVGEVGVLDHQVLARHVDPAPGRGAAGFDRYAVVAGVERDVVDDHAVAGLG